MITIVLPELMEDFKGIRVTATLDQKGGEINLITEDFNKRTKLEEVFDVGDVIRTVLSEEVEISTKLEVSFEHPDWGTIVGKVDTGADQTSLHAEDVEISGNYVKFSRNGSRYEMPLHGKTEISSADSENVRPNVEVIIKIPQTGKQQKVSINLNDRSDMPNELLIGMDILGGDDELRINPSREHQGNEINEEVFKEAIMALLEERE